MEQPWRPIREQIAAAEGRPVRDVIGPGLGVLFCGINPGLYSGAVGHHFARPGNRFWRTLHASGFTERVLSPFDEQELLKYGIGITNLVNRATARAEQLSPGELRAGARDVEKKVRRLRPVFVAFLGMGAYRAAFGNPSAAVGPQREPLAGSRAWLLPNPSGLNAHYQVDDLARAFVALRRAVSRSRPPAR